MAPATPSSTGGGSVVKRFNGALALLYLACILGSAPAIYLYTRAQVYDQARAQLTLLVDMVASIKGYVAKDLRPYFIEKGLFHVPGFSGIVATARVAGHFRTKQPSYVIRSVSDTPLNPANRPEPTEVNLLKRFRADTALKDVTEESRLGGKRVLLSASPMVASKGCLRCHGHPDQVPPQIVSEYGRDSGYGYQPGDIVGLGVIAVPLANVNDVALQRSLAAAGLLTLLFAAVFITVNLLVRRYLISPILRITEFSQAVAKGDLEQTLSMNRNDEIGELARAVELLRRSFAQIMKRMRKGS
jgi:HAMP domain-containing protein